MVATHHQSSGKQVLQVLFVCLVFLPMSVSSDSCVECHKNPLLRVQNPKLFDYYNQWVESTHRKAGVSCTHCHGGDPQAETKESAHNGGFLPSNPKSRVHYKNLPQTCGQCHQEITRHFLTSKHYNALIKEQIAPTCTTCHGSINAKAHYTRVIESICHTCHNTNNAQLPPLPKHAEEILQRLNISKGYLGWTELYFENRKNWPAKVNELRQRYQRIANGWHRFKIDEYQQDSIDLLADLRKIYEVASEESEFTDKSKPTMP